MQTTMKMKMANDVLVVEVEESMATVTDILVEAFQAAAVAASSSRQDALLTAVVVAAAAASVVVVVVVAAVKARKQKEVPAACRNVCRMVQTLHRRLARDIQMEEGSRNLEDHAKAKERETVIPSDRPWKHRLVVCLTNIPTIGRAAAAAIREPWIVKTAVKVKHDMLFFILFHRFTCFVCSQRMDLHVQEHHPVQTRWLLAYLLALALDHIPPTKHFRKREQKQTRFLLLLKKEGIYFWLF